MEYTTKLATNAEMKKIQHFQEPKGTIHRRLEITINLNADWGTDQVYINLHKFTPPFPPFFDIFPSDFFQKKTSILEHTGTPYPEQSQQYLDSFI